MHISYLGSDEQYVDLFAQLIDDEDKAERGGINMNGAAVVADILKREGTEFLACYPRNPLIEACAELDIRPILCRQERVGVGMADGFSRIRRGRRKMAPKN